MRKLFGIGIIGIWLVLLSIPMVCAQEGKEALLQKQSQAEVAADSNVYVIGPEDVLYIHVWKEENLSKAIPVRSDGKISLPLIDEIQAAGLDPSPIERSVGDEVERNLSIYPMSLSL